MRPSPFVLFFKRCIDLVTGLAGTLFFLALLPFIALIIKLDSPGPIFYLQNRVGLNRRFKFKSKRKSKPGQKYERRGKDFGGSLFKIIKFRTMRHHAEANGPQLCDVGSDSRITRAGIWLRFSHLDELPQVINILKGDMSLIGPRPERPFFTNQYLEKIPHYWNRTLFLRPGLTGLAQVSLGYDENFQSIIRKSHFDFSYQAALSSFSSWFRMDLAILYSTFAYLLKSFKVKPKELEGLKRAKLLPFKANTENPTSGHKIVVVNEFQTSTPFLLTGKDPAALSKKLQGINFNGSKSIFQVCVSPGSQFDLDDMGALVRLVHDVKKRGGRVAIKNNNLQVHKMLKEIHLDTVVDVLPVPIPVTNFMTIDVECWFHASNMRNKAPHSLWHRLPTRIIFNIERILALLNAHHTKATFFILGWVAENFPEVVQMIADEGHEIATRGYYHNLITEMTPNEFEDDLLKSLEAINRSTSKPVRGHRACNFTINELTLWALEILAKYGFEYDSSIYPIKRNNYGFPGYPNRLPHRILFEGEGEIIEIPMSTLKLGQKLLPISGGGYLRLYPYKITERYIHQINQIGVPAVVYFEPWELDSQQQRHTAGIMNSFRHNVNLESTSWKLIKLLERFRFTSIEDNIASERIQQQLQKDPIILRTVYSKDSSTSSVGEEHDLIDTSNNTLNASTIPPAAGYSA